MLEIIWVSKWLWVNSRAEQQNDGFSQHEILEARIWTLSRIEKFQSMGFAQIWHLVAKKNMQTLRLDTNECEWTAEQSEQQNDCECTVFFFSFRNATFCLFFSVFLGGNEKFPKNTKIKTGNFKIRKFVDLLVGFFVFWHPRKLRSREKITRFFFTPSKSGLRMPALGTPFLSSIVTLLGCT